MISLTTHFLVVVGALLGRANADYDTTVLTSVKENAVCSMASAVPPLDQAAYMYKTGALKHDPVANIYPNNTDDKIREMFGAATAVLPDVQAYFAGYQDGGFLIWFQEGAFSVPDSWNGNTNLSPYVWGYTKGPTDTCPSFGYPECRQEFYADKDTLVPITTGPNKEGFKGRTFDVVNRGWYADSVTYGSLWSDLYLDFSTGLTITSVCVVARNPAGQIIGVVAADVLLTAFAEALEEAVQGKSPNMRVFVMESETTNSATSKKQHLMIAASKRNVAFDNAGSQVEATNTSDPIITNIATSLIAKGVNANGGYATNTFISDGSFVQASEVSKIGGIPLAGGKSWFFVVVQPVECRPGWQVNTQTFKCERCVSPFNSIGGDAKCDICEPGYFMDNDGQCTECPEGTTCDGFSKTANLDLDMGYFRVSDAAEEVHECPIEKGCVGGTVSGQYCADGYESVLCASCTKEYYYHKDTNTCTDCGAPGVTTAVERVRASVVLSILFFFILIFCGGFMVLKFLPGMQGQVKEKIDALIEWLNVVRLKTKMKLKCLMSFAQISATVSFNCGMRFPGSFESIMNVFSIVNLEIVPALGVPCWAKQFDYIYTMMTMTLGPLALVAFIILVYIVNNFSELFGAPNKDDPMNRTRSRAELNEAYRVPDAMASWFTRSELASLRKTFAFFDADAGGDVDCDEMHKVIMSLQPEASLESVNDLFAEAKATARASKLGHLAGTSDDTITWTDFLLMTKNARDHDEETALSLLADQVDAKVSKNSANNYIYAILLVSFLVLPGTTTMLFNFFKCREFDVPGEGTVSYMIKDYAISCDSARYQSYIGYTIFMMLVYPIGIPCGWAAMLYVKQDILVDEKAMNREAIFGNPKTGHLSFLVESYKPKYYYFEVVECFRRILLTSAIGLADADTANAPIAGVIISLIFIFIFSEAKPFKQKENSALGILLMYTLTLIFLAALVSKVGAVGNNDDAFGAVLITILVGSLLLGLFISIVGVDFLDKAPAEEVESPKDAEKRLGARVQKQRGMSVDRPAKEVDVENALPEEMDISTLNPLKEGDKDYEKCVARLEKLGDLKEKGLITPESFESQVTILNEKLEKAL